MTNPKEVNNGGKVNKWEKWKKNNKMVDMNPTIIRNYFKYKWTKYSNKNLR